MRRWFRKKDRQSDDTQDEALSPQEVAPEETAPTLAQEALVAQEGQEPHLDASAPAEAAAEEGDSAGLSSETETDSVAPRRGFLRRMFRQERPLEELEPAGEESLPAVEPPTPPPEEPPELMAAGEEPRPSSSAAPSAPAQKCSRYGSQ